MPRMTVGLVSYKSTVKTSNANANDLEGAALNEALRCINDPDTVIAEADAQLAQEDADLVLN